jgi:hypothetical protein
MLGKFSPTLLKSMVSGAISGTIGEAFDTINDYRDDGKQSLGERIATVGVNTVIAGAGDVAIRAGSKVLASTMKFVSGKLSKIKVPNFEEIRKKVLENIGESKAARETSNYGEYLKKEKELLKEIEKKGVLEGTGKVQSGGKSDIFDPDEYLRNLDKADEMYDTFRSSTTDVASITRNTGMKDSRVQRIKEHLFIKEHIKDHGVGRFDADYDIAQAWERLQKGTYNQSDIDLLNHELFESRFEGIFKTNYRTAHDKTLESGRPWNP